MEQDSKIILFQEKQVRRVWHNAQWFFPIVDVIEVLTDSPRPRKYWNVLKTKLFAEGMTELSQNMGQLKVESSDGKKYLTDCANTEGVLRLIMSVPSPKAEPFKLWLARVGQEYAILTAEIAKATFGLTPSEHGKLKSLEKQNLRDHMTPLELIFTALGEEVTRSIAVADDAKGFIANQEAAVQGGKLAGDARERVERDKRVKVVSPENYLNQIQEAENQTLLPEENKNK